MMPNLKHDEAEQFLSFFPGPVLLCFDANNKDTILFDKYAPASMAAYNKGGRHVFFVVNELKGTSRRDVDVVRCRSVFIDDDGEAKGGFTDSSKFPIDPNLTVETSPGKYHHHWLTDTTDIDEWKGVQNTLIERFAGDPACRNPARIMRVPGYVNTKPTANGWVAKLTVHHTELYSWKEITTHFPPSMAEVLDMELPDGLPAKRLDVKEAMLSLVRGETVHETRAAVSFRWANLGMPKGDNKAIWDALIQVAHELGTVDKQRMMERLGNNSQVVESAYQKINNESGQVVELFDRSNADPYSRLPRPPGALGAFADDVKKYMHFESWEMALVVAQACVSTFGGGMYQFNGKMAIRPRGILAETGRGKDVTQQYFEELLRLLCRGSTHVHMQEFRGSTAHTPNIMHGELLRFRCRYIVNQEAGIAGQSKAGDQAHLRAYSLAWASKGYKTPQIIKQLSTRESKTANEELKPIYSGLPVITIESTPTPYIELLKRDDAFRSGEVGRLELVFVDPKKPYHNDEAEGSIHPAVLAAYKHMAMKFLQSGHISGENPSNPDHIQEVKTEPGVKEAMNQFSRDMIDHGNERLSDFDYVQHAMSSRQLERITVTMLVQALADAAWSKSEPVITMEHFTFAVEYQTELTRSLLAQSSIGALADPTTLCVERVSKRRENFGKLSYDKNYDVANRVISRGWLSSVLDRSKVKEFDTLCKTMGDNRDRAIHAVVSMCEDLNILTKVPSPGTKDKWRLNQ